MVNSRKSCSNYFAKFDHFIVAKVCKRRMPKVFGKCEIQLIKDFIICENK